MDALKFEFQLVDAAIEYMAKHQRPALGLEIISGINGTFFGVLNIWTVDFSVNKLNLKRPNGPIVENHYTLTNKIQKREYIPARKNYPTIPKPNDLPSHRENLSAPKVDVSSMMSIVHSMATNERSYKCSFCNFETTHLTSMTRHIQIKHLPNTVMFKCRQCEFDTKFKHNLKSHYMKTHKMPEPAARGMMAE